MCGLKLFDLYFNDNVCFIYFDLDICDLSSLDESIILQEKKVELERVQAEKLRLEKKLAEQAQVRLNSH